MLLGTVKGPIENVPLRSKNSAQVEERKSPQINLREK